MNRPSYGLLVAAIFVLLLLLFIYSVANILLLLFIAILFALYLGAITDALQTRLALPRPLGLLAALILTIIVASAIGYIIFPPLVQQTQDLLGSLPTLVPKWEAQLMALAQRSPFAAQLLGQPAQGETYIGRFIGEIGGYFKGAVPYVFSGVEFFIEVVSVLVMGLYLTLRPMMYREGFILLVPPLHRELVRDILGDLGRTLRAWIVGQLLAMFVLGVLTWIGLEILQVPFALAFGVFTAIAAIVPFFGTLVSTLLPALFVLGTGSIGHAMLVVLLGVIVHLIEANFVAPLIMERQVHIPPVLSILGVLIMAELLNVIGLLVAVPTLATLIVIARRVYVHRLLEGKGFRRAVRDRPVELALPGDGVVLVNPQGLERTVPALLEE